jgi:hypothetical protein
MSLKDNIALIFSDFKILNTLKQKRELGRTVEEQKRRYNYGEK